MSGIDGRSVFRYVHVPRMTDAPAPDQMPLATWKRRMWASLGVGVCVAIVALLAAWRGARGERDDRRDLELSLFRFLTRRLNSAHVATALLAGAMATMAAMFFVERPRGTMARITNLVAAVVWALLVAVLLTLLASPASPGH